ncbi:Phospholipase A1-Igamma2, chloroplastic [Stylosanthes scabra]|uniref:Phospholipase A1-Igamma2, chloroplastic n=1 Tax=Stylosanthes scabra TaxID=79078 RepID=A0ABU6XV35_9FABA|nr:Phospholipase A1-Igamma2, chloroplastic [Stylosanthes scabra]
MAAATSISNTLIPFHKTQQKSQPTKTKPITLCMTIQEANNTTTSPTTSTEITAIATATTIARQQNLDQEQEAIQHIYRKKPRHPQEHHNKRKLRHVWREIQGESDWAGLLDPMDPILRLELIRYGEMAQACYDAFDFDPFSKYCGSCRFTRCNFFSSLGMNPTRHGYTVTRYLYATANINLPNFFRQSRWPKMWSKNANWAGYVAVSNDEMSTRIGRRDVVVAWRGTVTHLEWVADLMDFLKPFSAKNIPCPDPTVKVESGFLELYTEKDESCGYCKYSAREQILTEIKRLLEMYPNEELSITMTGHSLGAALATLSAYDIVETGLNVVGDNRAVPVSVFSFSGPRVGNVRFKERLETLGLKVLRVLNVHDMVPKSPGLVFNEHLPASVMKLAEGLPWSYSHVGVELALDHKNSPFLNPNGDAVCAHNLEALLHLIDGLVLFYI